MKTALLAPICLLLVNLNLLFIKKNDKIRFILFISALLCVLSSQVVLTSKTSAFYDDTNYCPSADSISPCQCNSYPTSRGNNIHLDCGWTHLGDSKFSEVLQLIWENNGWNKLGSIVAFSCSLTKIPDEITRFRSLGKIELYNNRITSIESGAFDFSSAPYRVEIDLTNNDITFIDTGAFNFGASTKIIDINFRSNEIATVSPNSFQGKYSQDLLNALHFHFNNERFCLEKKT